MICGRRRIDVRNVVWSQRHRPARDRHFQGDPSMLSSHFRRILLTAVVVTCIVLSGCSETRLPSNAQLIWSGQVDQPGDVWKDVHPMATGQIYAVDHATGRVEGVDSVWSGKPEFNFQLRPHRKYDLYLVAESNPATA